MSYSTAESGRSEVLVSPVPAAGRRWQVSIEGGVQPVWRADGRELYYLGLDAGLYAVEIRVEGDELKAGRPLLLFRTTSPSHQCRRRTVPRQGRWWPFSVLHAPDVAQREPLRMLLNWPARLVRPK
jgi:hypothetical protein